MLRGMHRSVVAMVALVSALRNSVKDWH